MNHSRECADAAEGGLILVLPGIEGESRWNHSIVRGLRLAGLPCTCEIHDWTWGRWLSLYSLRCRSRHCAQADLIAEKIADFRSRHPAAPVWLIGHSGGGAMSVLSLERLAEDVRAEGAILLGPALSPGYDLSRALERTRLGIWNFCSLGDVLFLMAGTLVFGTVDGRHSISAGAIGFRGGSPALADDRGTSEAQPGPSLTQIPWRLPMLRQWNCAGHFGYVHHCFVREWVAPIVRASLRSAQPDRNRTAV